MAHNLATPCLGREPKARVATLSLEAMISIPNVKHLTKQPIEVYIILQNGLETSILLKPKRTLNIVVGNNTFMFSFPIGRWDIERFFTFLVPHLEGMFHSQIFCIECKPHHKHQQKLTKWDTYPNFVLGLDFILVQDLGGVELCFGV